MYESTTLSIIYLISIAISVALLIGFYNLCVNVAAIKRHLIGDKKEPENLTGARMLGTIDELKKDFKYDKDNLRLTESKKLKYIDAFKNCGLTDEQINEITK